jgi:hypothetical protein
MQAGLIAQQTAGSVTANLAWVVLLAALAVVLI